MQLSFRLSPFRDRCPSAIKNPQNEITHCAGLQGLPLILSSPGARRTVHGARRAAIFGLICVSIACSWTGCSALFCQPADSIVKPILRSGWDVFLFYFAQSETKNRFPPKTLTSIAQHVFPPRLLWIASYYSCILSRINLLTVLIYLYNII